MIIDDLLNEISILINGGILVSILLIWLDTDIARRKSLTGPFLQRVCRICIDWRNKERKKKYPQTQKIPPKP